MFTPVFNLQLKHKISPGTAAIGKYDGIHPCLTCATTAAKVFIHNPHKQADSGGRVAVVDNDISLLNVNQTVTALCTGKLDPAIDRDILCIGSQTNLLAYDVHDNRDLFYKDVPDGINKVIIGEIAKVNKPIVIAGGNCTLVGFDAEGTDKFWTVTGDEIHAFAFVDITNNGVDELIVGSEDFEIRAFEYDEIIAEMTETEAITSLCRLDKNRFGYALANGTVGLYDQTKRNWRIKSKNNVMTLHAYDIDGDGVKELITGWSNGKIDARSNESGEIIFKDTLESAVAGLVDADYRLNGKEQLICCSVEGEVRGYESDSAKVQSMQVTKKEDEVKDLSHTKQNLLLELQNCQESAQPVKAEDMTSTEIIETAAIQSNTDVTVKVNIESGPSPSLQLAVSSTSNAVVRMVVIFAEGMFSGESLVAHPPANSVSTTILVPLHPDKDIAVDLHIHAFVSLPGSSKFHVFIRKLSLPKFSSYLQTDSDANLPKSYVSFEINERLERVVIWFTENFLLHKEIPCEESIAVKFIAIRGGDFTFKMDSNGQVSIYTENIDLAGDLIQSLASYLRLEHLQVSANFPDHLQKLADIMDSVEGLHSVTQRLAAEMTDHSNLIRSLVVRAEDARLQDDFAGMRKGYSELHDLNRDLLSGYHVRSTNHEELVKSLKLVNQFIQKASHLRVGKYQSQVISHCRDAIKSNKTATLLKVIQVGSA